MCSMDGLVSEGLAPFTRSCGGFGKLGREAARKTELEIQDTRSKRVAKLSPNPKSLFLSMEQTISPSDLCDRIESFLI